MIKKLFAVSSIQRNWSMHGSLIKRRHEFDKNNRNTFNERYHSLTYDEIMSSDKYKIVPNGSFLRKLSEITRLPGSIIETIVLDFVDLVTITLAKDKEVSFWSFGKFVKTEDNKINFIPSEAWLKMIETFRQQLKDDTSNG